MFENTQKVERDIQLFGTSGFGSFGSSMKPVKVQVDCNASQQLQQPEKYTFL